MDFQVKLFNWQDQGNHLIVLARGTMDKRAFGELFREIEIATEHLSECKVLVDLSDSAYEISHAEIDTFVAELPLYRWPRGNKVAFVSTPETSCYNRLEYLRIALAPRNLPVGLFRDTKIAIDWLAGIV